MERLRSWKDSVTVEVVLVLSKLSLLGVDLIQYYCGSCCIQLQGGDTSSCCKFWIFLGDVKGKNTFFPDIFSKLTSSTSRSFREGIRSPPKKLSIYWGVCISFTILEWHFGTLPRSDATASTHQEVQPRDSMTSKRDGQWSLWNPRWLCETEPEEMRFWDHDPWKIRVTKRHGKYWLKVHIFSKVKKICQKSKDCLQDEGKYNSF